MDSLSLAYLTGIYNGAFMRVNPAGTATWLTQFSATTDVTPSKLVVDPATGNVFSVGNFRGSSALLGSGASSITVTSPATRTGYYLKLSGSTGTPVFLKTVIVGPNPLNTAASRQVWIEAAVFDAATQSIWMGGYYTPGDVTFAGQTLAPYNVINYSGFLLRFAAADGAELWAANYISESPTYSGNRCVGFRKAVLVFFPHFVVLTVL